MRRRRTLKVMLVGTLLLAGLAAPRGADAEESAEPALPIVFVHGGSGSGAQYETPALRWASNDYPKPVAAIDRTTSNPAVLNPILDDFIDDVLAQTGDDQVYLVGHSLGVALSINYLNSSPERTARVARFIGIDSASAGQQPVCPGTPDPVACKGIYRAANADLFLGDDNVYLPGHGHTEAVTSVESFVEQYQFFTGEDPETTLVLPEPPGQVEVSGRALNFPANTGIAGATLQVWEVNERTGVRKTTEPIAEVELDATGNFGPISVNGQQRHEITVIRQAEDGPRVGHFYYEPWTRSNDLLRLNLAPIGSALDQAIDRGAHAQASVVRMKEWFGDNADPANIDELSISTTSASLADEPPVNILNGATAPSTASTIALIVFDIGADGLTDVSQLQNLGPFLSGIDVHMPATEPPDGTITFEHRQRRTTGDEPQVISTPNWATEGWHGMLVNFRDYVQDIETWGDCKRAGLCR